MIQMRTQIQMKLKIQIQEEIKHTNTGGIQLGPPISPVNSLILSVPHDTNADTNTNEITNIDTYALINTNTGGIQLRPYISPVNSPSFHRLMIQIRTQI